MSTTLSNICRSCLIPAAPGSVMINLNTAYENFQISEIITIITGIAVSPNISENLPDKICEACWSRFQNAFDLRTFFQISDNCLRQMLENENIYVESEKSEIDFEEEIDALKLNDLHTCYILEDDVLKSKMFQQIRQCICQFRCSTRKQLKSHIDSHEYPANCEICENKISNKAQIIAHLDKHKLGSCIELYHCDMCEREFKNSDSLNKHNQKKHASPRNNTPELVEEITEENANFIPIGEDADSDLSDSAEGMKMRDEQLFKCDQDIAFRCKPCNLVFIDKRRLKDHRKSFHPQKTYQCSFCGIFVGIKCLREHEATQHAGDNLPLECNRCPKRFAHKTSLKRHLLSHADIKPHVCQICGKAFIVKYKLIAHNNTHLRVKSSNCINNSGSSKKRRKR